MVWLRKTSNRELLCRLLCHPPHPLFPYNYYCMWLEGVRISRLTHFSPSKTKDVEHYNYRYEADANS